MELTKQQDVILSLPTLQETVKKFGVRTKKSLGQNFLFDLNLTAKIAKSAGNLKDSTIIEIGPGPGGLTRALLLTEAKKIIVIEQDSRCISILKELQNIVGDRLEIIEGDALEIKEEEILKEKAKIIANLPYNIATELLFKWIDKIELFNSFTLMFQKEVADRITSLPGNKTYGRLSVMVQWLCETSRQFDISPEAFYPPPKVTSSVITITPRTEPLATAKKEILEKICKATFGQRRKTLRASLKQISDEPETLLNVACIEETLRPEQIDVKQFCALARAFEYWSLEK